VAVGVLDLDAALVSAVVDLRLSDLTPPASSRSITATSDATLNAAAAPCSEASISATGNSTWETSSISSPGWCALDATAAGSA
jgi:hypothetical protein